MFICSSLKIFMMQVSSKQNNSACTKIWFVICRIWKDHAVRVLPLHLWKSALFLWKHSQLWQCYFHFLFYLMLCKALFSQPPGMTVPILQVKKTKLREAMTCPRPKRWICDRHKCSMKAQEKNKLRDSDSL